LKYTVKNIFIALYMHLNETFIDFISWKQNAKHLATGVVIREKYVCNTRNYYRGGKEQKEELRHQIDKS